MANCESGTSLVDCEWLSLDLLQSREFFLSLVHLVSVVKV